MKRIVWFAVVFLMVGAGWLGAQTRKATHPGMVVGSTPAGADVLINGQAIGLTPFVMDNMKPGRYVVVIRKAGYSPVARTVTIAGQQPVVTWEPTLVKAASLRANVKADARKAMPAAGKEMPGAGQAMPAAAPPPPGMISVPSTEEKPGTSK
ncbi:MAG: PEGA domain-containing protein [Candidatus Xenobia bacterium]